MNPTSLTYAFPKISTTFSAARNADLGFWPVINSPSVTTKGLKSSPFSKFASKSYQGTGLGLFICKSIIQAHGGRIWAENNNISADTSTGATITFSLPTATTLNSDN
ncbi:hypothetical protein BH18THE2_BH18THE2_37080 [soil metagenome]